MIESGQSFDKTLIPERIFEQSVPMLILINKIDLRKQAQVLEEINEWKESFKQADVIPVSALNQFNIAAVFDRILELLPDNPPYFPKRILQRPVL